MNKKILLSSVVASMLLFSGCGSDDSDTTNDSVSGVVADGYIKGAKVFLDMNCNGLQDNGELSAFTNTNGEFTLNTDANLTGACIVATGGFDTERGVEITSSLIAPAGMDANVTPLTTIAYTYAKENNLSYEEATNRLAEKLNLSPNDFTADPERNTKIKSITAQIQSAIDLVVDANNSINPETLYSDISKNIASATNEVNLSEAITNISIPDNMKQVLTAVITKLDQNESSISDFANIKDAAVNIITTDQNLSNLDLDTYIDSYADYVEASTTQNIDEAKRNIDSLSSDLTILKDTANSKIATVTQAKDMVSKARETMYEFVDPNIEDQESNTSTLVGNLINNVNNSLTPSIDNINSSLNDLGEQINISLDSFNTDIQNDFNTTLNQMNERLNSIAEVLNSYDENQSFSDINTTYGDVLSHEYNIDDNGIITDTYTINNQTLTVSYPQTTADFNNVDVTTNGEITLSDENYSLNISELSCKDSVLSLKSNVTINGNNDSLISGMMNIALTVNNENFIQGYIFSATSNIDISIDGDIKTSTNKEFKGLFHLTDTTEKLSGKYTDPSNNIELSGDMSINASENWKVYVDENENTLDSNEYWNNFLVIGDKLITQYDVDWNSKDLNVTTYDGITYQCHDDDLPDLTNISCENAYGIITKKLTDFDGKFMEFTVNDKTFIVSDMYYHWDSTASGEDKISLKVYSNKDYKLSYDTNGTYVLNEGNGIVENVTSLSYQPYMPMDTNSITGDVKFSGEVIKGDSNISLNLAIVKNSIGTSVDYYIDNLYLKSNNIEITAPNLLKVTAVDEKVANVVLNEFNATVVDLNGQEAKLTNVSYTGSFSNTDTNTSEFYGQISYADTTFSGYTSLVQTGENVSGSVYADIERIGYEPFTIISNGEGNDTDANISLLIKKGDYEIGGNFVSTDKNNTILSLYNNDGVFFNSETIYNEDRDDDRRVTLTDKDGNKLADINTTNNNWEIKYSDDSTETLY